jgi:Icc-related predicted phosphoesterase
MRITFISDTHTKHHQVTNDLPGGDLLIHAGDIMNSGRDRDDIVLFCDWFNELDNYTHKLFIAGNHDRLFETNSIDSTRLVREFKNIGYLEDSLCGIGDVSIWGSPWQPAFYDWAFNLPRNGKALEKKWKLIPSKIDILMCHTMPFGHCDAVGNLNVGCELLRVRVDKIRPKIFVGGHIHSGAGYKFDGHTHFFNASVLDNSYYYKNKPMTIDWNKETNEIKFL